MKIIFSRKGFDKRNGGVASPIFRDDGLRSFPIPAPWDQRRPPEPRYRVSYKNLSHNAEDLGSLVEELSFNRRTGESRVKGTDYCHLDPDLIRDDLRRKPGWLPIFGQGNGAAAQLLNQGVRKGDLFLFFGWFRRVSQDEGRTTFDPERQDAHVIFGWLQIGNIWCDFNRKSVLPKWANYHPHVRGEAERFRNLSKPLDVLFVASRRLELPGIRRRLRGAGVFKKYHSKLLLTELGETRRNWSLPAWMFPSRDKPALGFHGDRGRWHKDGTKCHLRTVDIGQEFVLDTAYYPEANHMLTELFRVAT